MLKYMLRAASMGAAFLAGVPAMAQDKLPDVRVYYGDLDLSDPAAVRVLDRRLLRAVQASCPNDSGVRELSQQRSILQCRAEKRAEVRPQRAAALASAAHNQNMFAAR
jgi:UrcA family protein